MATKTTSGTTEQPPKGAIVQDPELAAMNRIGKHLLALDDNQRGRVMTWLIGRFVPGHRVAIVTRPAETDNGADR